MRILKGIFIGSAVVLVIFLALGWFNTPLRIESASPLPIPADSAFALYKSSSFAPKWMGQLAGIRLVRGTEGLPGAVYRLKIEEEGTSYEMDYTFLREEPGKKQVYRLENEALVNEIEVLFEQQEQQSKISRTEAVTGKTAFMKSALFLMRNTLVENSDKDLKAFAGALSEK